MCIATNLHPFIPPNQGTFGKFGVSGIMAASGMIFFAYIGFEAVSRRRAGSEKSHGAIFPSAFWARSPSARSSTWAWRSCSRASPIGARSTCPIRSLSRSARSRRCNGSSIPIDIGAMVGLASVMFVGLYGQSRVFYSMARDGFLPPAFSAVHKRFKTPHRGTIITGFFAAVARSRLSVRHPGGTRLGRNAARLHRGLRRHHDPAHHDPKRETPLSDSFCVVRCAGRHRDLPRHDGEPFVSSPDTMGRLIVWTVIGFSSTSPTASVTRRHRNGACERGVKAAPCQFPANRDFIRDFEKRGRAARASGSITAGLSAVRHP